ncbi:hypothetical protein ACTGWU_10840, partial [Streptococcus suis]
MTTAGVCFANVCIDGEGFALDQAGIHACRTVSKMYRRMSLSRNRSSSHAQATSTMTEFLNINITASLAGRGGLNKYPCISVQPSAQRRS